MEEEEFLDSRFRRFQTGIASFQIHFGYCKFTSRLQRWKGTSNIVLLRCLLHENIG